jgi:hypothetical protein
MQNHFDNTLKTSLFTTGSIKTPSLTAPMSNISKFHTPKFTVARAAPKIQASRLNNIQMTASVRPTTQNTAQKVQEKI